MSHISYSELKDWSFCPFYHKLTRIDKIDGFTGNEYTAFGSAIHSVCEKKLLQEEIDTLKNLQTRQLDIASSLGRVEYNLQLLELQKEQIIEDLENLKKEEEKVGAELSKKYGNGSIDIDQGTFTKVN